jgi:lipoate-protein ligase B
MNLYPFKGINTCGLQSLEVTQINDLKRVSLQQVRKDLKNLLEDRNFIAA